MIKIPQLTGYTAKLFIERADNPKKIIITEQQLKMYLCFLEQR